MPSFLSALTQDATVDPLTLVVRLVAAALLGAVVGWIYQRTHGSTGADGLQTTLVMLAVLIAMVTQVIGDNVARAFSLVGALSIVRFRTVVRDTRDTAFVIFSVVVGMAVGSQHPWVAVLGILVGGAVAFVLAPRENALPPLFTLRLRASAGVDTKALVAGACGGEGRMVAVESTRQGTLLEATYGVRLAGDRVDAVVRTLAAAEGIQEVRLQRASETE